MMEKMNIVIEGGKKLPPGFRFQPTDEEIVFQYLSRKTFSHPLPPIVIPESDVFIHDPWELPLPGDGEEDMYFFCNKESGNGRKMGRASESGFWKPTGLLKRIICSKKMPIIGIRKSYVFHRRTKHCRAIRTDWIMHEYYLALSQNPQDQRSLVRIGNWTLCRIFLKKRVSAAKVEEVRAYDFSSDSYSSSASSSDSSIFTEVSSS